MPDHRSEMRSLVRRDVAVFTLGSAVALVLLTVLALGALDLVGDRRAATVALAGAAPLCFGCLVWWLAGPRSLLRDRYLVMVPACLAGPAVVISLRQLDAGLVTVMFSSAFGFGAAIAAGLALAARRP